MLPSEQDLAEHELDLFVDRNRVFLGEAIELKARLAGEDAERQVSVECVMTLPDGREVPYGMAPRQVTTPSGRTYPGYALDYKAESPGLYNLRARASIDDTRVVSDPLSFFVKPFTPESMPRPVDVKVLRDVAGSSGGRFFESLPEMNRALAALRFDPIEEETSEFHSLWRTWPPIVLIMLFASAAWFTRKLRNMP